MKFVSSILPALAVVTLAQQAMAFTVGSVSIPDTYVSVPGAGYFTDPSCVHEIPNGATLDSSTLTVTKNGALIDQLTPCQHNPIYVTSGGSTGDQAPGTNGWVSYSAQDVPSGATTWN